MNLRTDEQYPASGMGADVGDRQGAASRFNGDIEQGKLLLKLINEGSVDKIETIMPEDISWVDE